MLWAGGVFSLCFFAFYMFLAFHSFSDKAVQGTALSPQALAGSYRRGYEPRKPAPHTPGVRTHLRSLLTGKPSTSFPPPLGVRSAAAGHSEAKPDGGHSPVSQNHRTLALLRPAAVGQRASASTLQSAWSRHFSPLAWAVNPRPPKTGLLSCDPQ